MMRSVAGLLVVVLATSACSLMWIKEQPKNTPEWEEPVCTTDEKPIYYDYGWLGVIAVVAIASLLGAGSSGDESLPASGIIVGGAIVGGAAGAAGYSAYVGRKRIKKCEQLKLEFMRSQRTTSED